MRAVFLTAVIFVSALTALCGCGRDTELPDAEALSALGELYVVSREEGSGTRAEFENLVGTDESGSDVTVESTDDVIAQVSENDGAIGYLAFDAAGDEQTGVKTLSVSGIEPGNDTIKDGSYPLCRNYYLAYNGELSDAENDFIAYVMSAGQDVVGEYAVQVKSGSTFLSDKSSGTIEIAGSSSMAPIIEALAEDYMNYNPNVEIDITMTDSTQGLTAAMEGECDIAMSSRELEDYEEELLTKKSIARDALAIIVNEKNPVTDLSLEQIKNIYDNGLAKWQELAEE